MGRGKRPQKITSSRGQKWKIRLGYRNIPIVEVRYLENSVTRKSGLLVVLRIDTAGFHFQCDR